MELRAITGSVIGTFDGIRLADVRWGKKDDEFKATMEGALRLVQEHDPRRYQRIKRHLDWIINRVTPGGARYQREFRACIVEFESLGPKGYDIQLAFYACIIIHEATHGFLEFRGAVYDEENRMQSERICMAEENRFAARLAKFDPERYPADLLQSKFNPKDWEWEWNATPKQRRREIVSLFLSDMKKKK